jgi:hypothetical protein
MAVLEDEQAIKETVYPYAHFIDWGCNEIARNLNIMIGI